MIQIEHLNLIFIFFQFNLVIFLTIGDGTLIIKVIKVPSLIFSLAGAGGDHAMEKRRENMENCTKNFETFVLPATVVKNRKHTNFRRYFEAYRWCSSNDEDKELEAYNIARRFCRSYEDYFLIYRIARSRSSINEKTALSDLLELDLTPDQCLEVCRASKYSESALNKIKDSGYSFCELYGMYIECNNPIDKKPLNIIYDLMNEKVINKECVLPERLKFEKLSKK